MKILLYSGGIDSLIAWYYLNYPDCLYVDLGTKYSVEEQWNLIAPEGMKLKTITHKSWGIYEFEDAWLPMRNALLTMLAAAEGADTIYLVAQKGEQGIPDRSPQFFEDMSRFLTLHNKREIVVEPVFPHMDKQEMVKWYLDQGYDPGRLVRAFSCYSRESPCGRCSACWRKFIALTVNGIKCDHIFRNDVRMWGEVNYRSRLDEYIPERVGAMKKVMGWV